VKASLTSAESAPPVVDVQELVIDAGGPGGDRLVDGIDLTVRPREVVGVVGESGSGKSMSALAIMGLLPSGCRISHGTIMVNGTNTTPWDETRMRGIRGGTISMIFQEPMTSLNPMQRIGTQIAEMFRVHGSLGRKDAWSEAVRLLDEVGIVPAASRAKSYPHQLSGGMRQRVMIAMAMALKPSLLIADEPTTALDVTVQAQILDLLDRLRDENDTAVLLVSHDMGVIARMADYVIVMQSGRVKEAGSAVQIFEDPADPYTKALLYAVPWADRPPPPSGLLPTFESIGAASARRHQSPTGHLSGGGSDA